MRPKADPEILAAAEDRFWELCGPLLARDDTEEGKLMRSRCLRVNSEFVAMIARSGQLVVKLSAERVDELIADGAGEAFAPAGKVFKEWVAVPAGDGAVGDDSDWIELIEESHRWVAEQSGG